MVYNGAIPSRKCSIKAPAEWRNSVYVLMEICPLWSKRLGPWSGIILCWLFYFLSSHQLQDGISWTLFIIINIWRILKHNRAVSTFFGIGFGVHDKHLHLRRLFFFFKVLICAWNYWKTSGFDHLSVGWQKSRLINKLVH